MRYRIPVKLRTFMSTDEPDGMTTIAQHEAADTNHRARYDVSIGGLG
jgi:hypothetical protein